MLPAAASIRKQGANKGATTAFLIATPESGIDSISVTWALLDPLMTVVRPLAAFVSAMVAGILENVLFWERPEKTIVVDNSCPVDGCCDGKACSEEEHRHHHTLWEKIVAGIQFAIGSVWGDIAGWFFLGVLLAAAITVIIPEQVMTSFLGGGFSSMLIMLVIGIPLYICATASTPVAAALILKGVSPGAALVFLLVGPATNIASLSVLVGILGKRSTVLYLVALAVCAIFFGLGVDLLYLKMGISPQAVVGSVREVLPEWLKILSAIIVCAISVKPLWRMLQVKRVKKEAAQTTFVSDFPIVGPKKKNPPKDFGRDR